MLSKKDKQGYALIGVVASFVLALVVFKVVHQQRTPGPDNCVGTPSASTAIVIDRSDGVPQQTLDEIRARALAFIVDSVQANERVSVFTVDESSTRALAPLVSLCRPRRTGNALTENVRGLEKAYHTRFEAPLDSALAVRPATSKESPIAQALTDISLTEYLRAPKNTLIVFSDMLENTPAFSLYRCSSPEGVIPAFRISRKGAEERPHFRNTMVRLNIIPRLGQRSDEIACRDRLWTWFFGDDSGQAAGLTLDYLPGGATLPAVAERAK